MIFSISSLSNLMKLILEKFMSHIINFSQSIGMLGQSFREDINLNYEIWL